MPIPLPALDVQTTQTPDLMTQYGNLLKLQGMRQQQAIAPLQQQSAENEVQSSQLQLQQQQQAQKDQQANTAAMDQWDGKNFQDYIALAKKNGASATSVLNLQGKYLQQKQTAAATAASDATTGAKNIDTLIKKNDVISGSLSTLIDPQQAPDAQLPQAIMQHAQQLQQEGVLDSQHMQAATKLSQLAQTNPAQARQGIDSMRKGVMSNTQILDEAQKKAQTAKSLAQPTQAAATLANTQAYQRAELNQGAQRIGVERERLNLQQQQSGLSPNGAPSDLAHSIASGHVTPERLSYLLARNPELIQGVMQIDPSFDSSKAAAYPRVYQEFTSTKKNTAGGQINAAATALNHLAELRAMNTVESHIPGTSAYVAYSTKANKVATELATLYANDTVPGIESYRGNLMSQFPGNRDASIVTEAQSLGDKLDNFKQQWDNAAPSKAYEAPMPGISLKAMQDRASLDPRYAARIRQNSAANSGTIIQHSASTGQYRYSTDGGKTWQPGQPSHQ